MESRVPSAASRNLVHIRSRERRPNSPVVRPRRKNNPPRAHTADAECKKSGTAESMAGVMRAYEGEEMRDDESGDDERHPREGVGARGRPRGSARHHSSVLRHRQRSSLSFSFSFSLLPPPQSIASTAKQRCFARQIAHHCTLRRSICTPSPLRSLRSVAPCWRSRFFLHSSFWVFFSFSSPSFLSTLVTSFVSLFRLYFSYVLLLYQREW
jgi:hypothetical protein